MGRRYAAVLWVTAALVLGSMALGWRVSGPPRPAPGPESEPDHALTDPGRTAFLQMERSPAGVLSEALTALAANRGREAAGLFVHAAEAGELAVRMLDWVPAGGRAQVAQADQVDAGAENGHSVPVTVWFAATDQVAALSGHVRFTSAGSLPRIAELELSPVSLRVAGWSQAERSLNRPNATRVAGLFFGRFRFHTGDRQWAVDAVTGLVEEE